MKKLCLIASFIFSANVHASVIAILDNGVDFTHKDLVNRKWTSPNDTTKTPGWNFVHNSNVLFDDQHVSKMTPDIIKALNLYSKYELNQLSDSEVSWLKEKIEDDEFNLEMGRVYNYSQGTHNAAVAIKNNPLARVMALKVDYTQFELDEQPYETPVNRNKTTEEIYSLILSGEEDVQRFAQPAFDFLKENSVDVAYYSYGVDYFALRDYVHAMFMEHASRVPTQQEETTIIDLFCKQAADRTSNIFNSALRTLIILPAMGPQHDIDSKNVFYGNMGIDNFMVVTSSNGYTKLSDDSPYGKSSVDVAAPGTAVEEAGPGQNYLSFSSASTAASYVVSVAAEMKDINSKLNPYALRRIILGTVDKKQWLKGKVISDGVVNKKRALSAANNTRFLSIDRSIETALQEVKDN